MRSSVPKVLQPLAGAPLLYHVISAVRHLSKPIGIIYSDDRVRHYVENEPAFKGCDFSWIEQRDPRGTADAMRFSLPFVRQHGTVLVVPGDMPLIHSGIIDALQGSNFAFVTTMMDDPVGYGRVIRTAGLRIVEDKDASFEEKKIHECAVSIYIFPLSLLEERLPQVTDQNAQGEYYLTDLISGDVQAVLWPCAEDCVGVNTGWELARAEEIFARRQMKRFAQLGVKFLSTTNVFIDVHVSIEPGTIIYPGVMLRGKVRIGAGVILDAGVIVTDADIGENAHVGPYAHIRPGTSLGARSRVGNFVEIKASRCGEDTKIAHLSYVGDADIGARVNIGCGFVTCNYDGQKKHRSSIEDDVFMGSDCQVVAPIRIGKGAYIAAGSTIVDDVEPGALAIARSRQVSKPGYKR